MQPGIHHLALVCGEPFLRYVPDGIPRLISKVVSSKDSFYQQDEEKVYDWCWLTSFDEPRKRVGEFLSMLHSVTDYSWQGLIMAKDPRNKITLARNWPAYRRFRRGLSAVRKSKRALGFDLFLNPTLRRIRTGLNQSKVFVCISALDAGPRTIIEVLQCEVPVLTMEHIGNSDVIFSGVSGEVVSDLPNVIPTLERMIEGWAGYNVKQVLSTKLNEEHDFPQLVARINQEYDRFTEGIAV